ncbi:MAG TPA: hypothetical protein VK773_09015 [Acidimicrobiales bacterium]|jgi:hypothetical protein|nr:hypothetical protein [Acidimicrobiales bacterium]
MQAAGCTGLDALNPVCQIGSLGGSLATSGFESVLNGISQWVASGAEYLLRQIGTVLVSTTTVDVGATWFRTHYGQMTALAGVVILPMLLLSTLQAVLRQNPGQLVRTYLVQLPFALLLAAVAIQVVVLSLSVTDAMSDAVAGGTGADVTSLLSTVTTGLVASSADPSIASFVLLLIALLIAVAAFVLWLELLIRAAAVYVAVLFLPLALATLVWPAVSHWCRRLVETLAALILSKFVIVAVLSLAAGAVASGVSGSANSGGFNAVLAGGALLVMATFVPFAILRLIPAIEAGAVGHLEGLRQRGTGILTGPARTAATHALHEGLQTAGAARLMRMTPAAASPDGGGADGGAGAGAGTEPEPSGADSGGVFATPHEMHGELVACGRIEPRPKGPKPIVGWTETDGDGGPDGGGGVGDVGGATAEHMGHPSAGDAWKYKGMPAGTAPLYPVRPGVHRFYIDNDERGLPKMFSLDPAWPSDDADEDV